MQQLLAKAVAAKASDIHLKVGQPPGARVRGDMVYFRLDKVKPEDTEAAARIIIKKPEVLTNFDNIQEYDTSYGVPGLGRFRVNIYRQKGTLAIVMRAIPLVIPTFAELGAPAACLDLAEKDRGLVLVVGPTGSGKSTTLAAMIDYRNRTSAGHIITVEDPVEYRLDGVVQLPVNTKAGFGFANALRAILRHDPDVILVGEMRDLETIRLAMTAAETGHLVFGTLHTSSAAKTIDRIIDVFPGEEKDMIRAMLSESLQAVISQTLCKTKDGQGRVAAHEIMLGTPAIRNLIREGKVAQMYSSIQTGSGQGMQTLDQNLTDLVRRSVISSAEARGKAKIPENFPG